MYLLCFPLMFFFFFSFSFFCSCYFFDVCKIYYCIKRVGTHGNHRSSPEVATRHYQHRHYPASVSFVSFRFVSSRFVSSRFVSFRFVSFRFVSFRFISSLLLVRIFDFQKTTHHMICSRRSRSVLDYALERDRYETNNERVEAG